MRLILDKRKGRGAAAAIPKNEIRRD